MGDHYVIYVLIYEHGNHYIVLMHGEVHMLFFVCISFIVDLLFIDADDQTAFAMTKLTP